MRFLLVVIELKSLCEFIVYVYNEAVAGGLIQRRVEFGPGMIE